jgi:fibro-slime domain-containing protein
MLSPKFFGPANRPRRWHNRHANSHSPLGSISPLVSGRCDCDVWFVPRKGGWFSGRVVPAPPDSRVMRGVVAMERKRWTKYVTDRRLQGLALILIGAAGLRQATLASSDNSGSSNVANNSNAYPLIAIARDFRPGHADFGAGVGDNLSFSVGNIASTLDANGRPSYVGGGKVVTASAKDAAGRYIMPAAVQAKPVTDFSINGASVSSSNPMVAKITIVGAAIVSGSTPCPVAMRVKVGNSYHEPFGAFSNKTAANVNDNRNPRTAVLPGTIAAGTSVSIDGQTWLPGSNSVYMTVNSANGGAQVKALRNGDSVPNTTGFAGQVSAKAMLTPYLDSTGKKIKLNSNQVIYLFELGTTSTTSSAFDMQDLVVLVDLATDPSYFQAPAPVVVTDACGNVVNDTAATFGDVNGGGIMSAATFSQWFSDVPGANASQRIFLSMNKGSDGVYSFSTSDFTPMDGELYGNQGASHNRGFTCSIDAVTGYKKCTGQFIEYAGAGDAWLFINGKLAMDMGGTHANGKQVVLLDRLNLTDGAEVRVNFFYAQRTSNNATFGLRTNLVLSTPNSVGTPGVSGMLD